MFKIEIKTNSNESKFDNVLYNMKNIKYYEAMLKKNNVYVKNGKNIEIANYNVSFKRQGRDCFKEFLEKNINMEKYNVMVFIDRKKNCIIGYFAFVDVALSIDDKNFIYEKGPIRELVMFALDLKYQGLRLHKNKSESLAKVLLEYSIIYTTIYDNNKDNALICLYSVPTAINFYEKCGFTRKAFQLKDEMLKSVFMYVIVANVVDD